ncbi:hypothetical protein [Amycolatopsis lurida]
MCDHAEVISELADSFAQDRFVVTDFTGRVGVHVNVLSQVRVNVLSR